MLVLRLTLGVNIISRPLYSRAGPLITEYDIADVEVLTAVEVFVL